MIKLEYACCTKMLSLELTLQQVSSSTDSVFGSYQVQKLAHCFFDVRKVIVSFLPPTNKEYYTERAKLLNACNLHQR